MTWPLAAVLITAIVVAGLVALVYVQNGGPRR